MIRAVLDTNIIVSALFWSGAPYKIVQAGIKDEFRIITSLEILGEAYATLEEKFKVPRKQINSLVKVVTLNSEIVYPKLQIAVVKKDPSDNKIIECALEGNADYIISGDKHLLEIKKYKEVEIISPSEFWSTLKGE